MLLTSKARLHLAIVAIVFNCGMSQAQNAGRLGLGATSPLGGLGSTTSGAPTGIPLGSTEIDPGGLSPLPCPSTASSSLGTSTSGFNQATTVPGSSFDGGGLAVTSCSSGSAATVSSTGSASPLFRPGTTAASSIVGGTLPLGSIAIDSAGVSPMIVVPPPGGASPATYLGAAITVPSVFSTSPCTGSTTATSAGTGGSTSSGLTSGIGVTSTGC